MIILKHLKTILTHKYYVFFFASKIGIAWQGFWHDMSKLSPVEFCESVKYYTGTRSPIDVCKETNGYSLAWQFHKGRNPHHYEFWQDNFDKGGQSLRMPDKYVKEMICDYLAAGRAYKGKDFTFTSEWEWWQIKTKNNIAMHPKNKEAVNTILSCLNSNYGTKKISELTKSDWMYFRMLVENTLSRLEE